MKRSTFLPVVTIDDDGRVEFDWADSYSETYDTDTNQSSCSETDHSDLLDRILGPANIPDAERLRRLAWFIETGEIRA